MHFNPSGRPETRNPLSSLPAGVRGEIRDRPACRPSPCPRIKYGAGSLSPGERGHLRMGAAIRKLAPQAAATKILLLLSDGRPQDRGYSRQGTEKAYAVHDTHMALVESRARASRRSASPSTKPATITCKPCAATSATRCWTTSPPCPPACRCCTARLPRDASPALTPSTLYRTLAPPFSTRYRPPRRPATASEASRA